MGYNVNGSYDDKNEYSPNLLLTLFSSKSFLLSFVQQNGPINENILIRDEIRFSRKKLNIPLPPKN